MVGDVFTTLESGKSGKSGKWEFIHVIQSRLCIDLHNILLLGGEEGGGGWGGGPRGQWGYVECRM